MKDYCLDATKNKVAGSRRERVAANGTLCGNSSRRIRRAHKVQTGSFLGPVKAEIECDGWENIKKVE